MLQDLLRLTLIKPVNPREAQSMINIEIQMNMTLVSGILATTDDNFDIIPLTGNVHNSVIPCCKLCDIEASPG